MGRIKDDQMIKAFPADRSHKAFDEAILPRAAQRRWTIANAYGAELFFECNSVNRIIVPDQMIRRLIPGKGLNNLTRGPFRRRVICNANMQKLSSPMPQNDEGIKKLEADRGNNQKVNGCNTVCVIAYKCIPAL